jgi:hypothetical protein
MIWRAILLTDLREIGHSVYVFFLRGENIGVGCQYLARQRAAMNAAIIIHYISLEFYTRQQKPVSH